MSKWYLYIIRCGDGSLYTGITTNIKRRLNQHRSGKGSKYLRGKDSLDLVYQIGIGSRSDALKLESKIKKMKKSEKELLISKRDSP